MKKRKILFIIALMFIVFFAETKDVNAKSCTYLRQFNGLIPRIKITLFESAMDLEGVVVDNADFFYSYPSNVKKGAVSIKNYRQSDDGLGFVAKDYIHAQNQCPPYIAIEEIKEFIMLDTQINLNIYFLEKDRSDKNVNATHGTKQIVPLMLESSQVDKETILSSLNTIHLENLINEFYEFGCFNVYVYAQDPSGSNTAKKEKCLNHVNVVSSSILQFSSAISNAEELGVSVDPQISSAIANLQNKIQKAENVLTEINELKLEGETITLNGDFTNYDNVSPVTCTSIKRFSTLLIQLLELLRIAGAVLFVGLGIVDFAKATMSGEQDLLKKASSNFVKRGIALVVLFLLPIVLNLILKLAGISTDPLCGIGL